MSLPPPSPSRRARLGGLIRAAHIGPTLAVTAFATALAVRTKGGDATTTALAILTGQLAVGWSNDYLDRERDLLAGRTDKPIVMGAVRASDVGVSAVIAGTACLPLSFRSGRRAGFAHLAAMAAALSYNAGLKSTAWSVAPYAFAFGSLPAFISLQGQDGHRPPVPASLAGALLGAGAHFVNTLPDVEADAATGVRGLPQRLGRVGATSAGVVLLGSAVAVVARAGEHPMGGAEKALTGAAAASVCGVLGAVLVGRERIAWWLSITTAGSAVALYLSRSERE